MTTFLYVQSPLDPSQITRYWPDAGLAYEKHHWRLPIRRSLDHPVRLFNFGHTPLREFYIERTDPRGELLEPLPFTTQLAPDAIPAPPLHLSVVADLEGRARAVVQRLVIGWPTPVHLLFSPAQIPPFEPPPRQTIAFVEELLGHPWQGPRNPGWVPLPTADLRQRAIDALGIKGFHRFYLVAGPTMLPVEMQALFSEWNGLTRIDQPEIDYHLFHTLVSTCDWVLTTHGNVSGATPFCFYSASELRPDLRKATQEAGEVLVEFNDISDMNRAAGITVKARGGLTLSEIMPLSMLTGQTELSLSWSNLDRLDELPPLPALRHLDLDATLVNDLAPLARMPNLEELSLRFLQLASLQPLTALLNLRKLALNRTPVAGLNPLAAIPALESLDLGFMPIKSVAALTACRHLQDLTLDRTLVVHLDEVAQLRSLQRLSIAFTPVVSIHPLTALTELRELILDGCHLEDLSALSSFTALQTLSLSSPGERLSLPDVAPIAAIKKLKHLQLVHTTFQSLPIGPVAHSLERLDISGSQVQSLRWLAEFEMLRELALADTLISDLAPIETLHDLLVLNINFCRIEQYDSLHHFKHLQQLEISQAILKHVDFLADMPAMRSLNLASAQVADISGALALLAGLSDLESLDLYRWRLGSFAWLVGLNKLRRLNLARTDLDDTAPLQHLIHLTALDLSHTAIQSLAGLNEIGMLQDLNLESTQVTDLSPLHRATKLESLNLRNTPITNIAVLATLRQLKKLDLRNKVHANLDLRPLLDLPRLQVLHIETHGIAADVFEALMHRHRVIIRQT